MLASHLPQGCARKRLGLGRRQLNGILSFHALKNKAQKKESFALQRDEKFRGSTLIQDFLKILPSKARNVRCPSFAQSAFRALRKGCSRMHFLHWIAGTALSRRHSLSGASKICILFPFKAFLL